MKQVDFYLIANRVDQANFKLASRLANKLHKMSKSVLIVTDDEAATTSLEETLWQFSDTSFAAHDRLDDGHSVARIQIGEHQSVDTEVLDRNHDVLINLCQDVPIFNHHFTRIAEIIPANDEAKAAGRARYKRYQTEGFELKMHNIEL